MATAVRRVGIGSDSHPFGPGRPLRLGGVTIDRAPALAGHSDGDVALHAVADALLGAAALGDLGRHHPPDERTPRGVPSTALLASIAGHVRDAGWQPEAVDVTIVAARPRLADQLEAMRAAIAEVLGLPVDAVSVKASTGNLSGDAGAGRTVEARALASIVPTDQR